METEQARGLGDVTAAFEEHAVDVLPLDPFGRHRIADAPGGSEIRVRRLARHPEQRLSNR